MKIFKAKEETHTLIYKGSTNHKPYPYFRCGDGDKIIYCVSPLHGRSFVVGKENGRYIVSKGNGLSYTKHSILHLDPWHDDSWGLLLIQDAKRDFLLGQEVESLGIKTNHMEYVLKLELSLGENISVYLLQYSVECPYRICDIPFMKRLDIEEELVKWKQNDKKNRKYYHMMAADILVRNLYILHSQQILHNAIHIQNYTWALELLDFELACSPLHPYSNIDDQRHAKDLFQREIMQTYEIINYIAWVIDEPIDYHRIDNIFLNYGFDLNQFRLI